MGETSLKDTLEQMLTSVDKDIINTQQIRLLVAQYFSPQPVQAALPGSQWRPREEFVHAVIGALGAYESQLFHKRVELKSAIEWETEHEGRSE